MRKRGSRESSRFLPKFLVGIVSTYRSLGGDIHVRPKVRPTVSYKTKKSPLVEVSFNETDDNPSESTNVSDTINEIKSSFFL